LKLFFKIYIWQLLSLISGFATMFVVTPYLTANLDSFGIYTFVISLNLFLSYADFGFLSAGIKYASEAFIKGDKKEEIEILGFVTYILCVVFFLFGLLISLFYFFPHWILSGLDSLNSVILLQDLFFVFILCLPILVAHRVIQLIYNIRLHDFKYQRIYSILNLFKISSVLFFFSNGEYHIVPYYIFSQLLTLICVIYGCYLARKNYNYNFKLFIRSIKFNEHIYLKTKKLAFNSLYVTFSWILYYELDSLIIGKFVGLKEVAIFNISISIMALARSLYGILYNPFTAKFNHYLGKNRYQELYGIFYKIIVIGTPISLVPTFVLILTMKSFINSWVGGEYYSSAILLTSVMFGSYFFSFVSYPTGIALVSLQKIKSLYLISTLLPIIYWCGIVLSFQYIGLMSFSVFKFISFFLSGLFYIYLSSKYLNVGWAKFLRNNFFAILGAPLVIYIVFLKIINYLPLHKGMTEMISYSLVFLFLNVIGFIFYFLFSYELRKTCKNILLNNSRE
jgi:O-antigen/teichoic acid export membrane protein